MIKAVLFDAGGVLHEANSAVNDDMVRELGITKSVLKNIWADLVPLFDAGKIDEAEFWRQVHKKHGVRQVTVAENLWGRAFAKNLRPYTQVADLVAALHNHGFTVAVLSNTIEPHAQILHSAGVYDGFDKLFLSHELGMRKPGADIYLHTLQTLGVHPAETIFIDDRRENVAAANALGIKGIICVGPEQVVADVQAALPDLVLAK